jgi:hypothetical protein
MTLKNTTAIILQGPVEYAEQIVDCYSHVKKNVIVSTNLIRADQQEMLEDAGFLVKKAKTPINAGKYNFNNQVATTHCGMEAAKEMGFEHVLKLRSDIMIDDIVDFISRLDRSSVYFSARHNHGGRSYFCEHMLFGPTDFMEKLWNIPESTSVEGPEIQLTRHFYSLTESYENVKFLFPVIYENEFDAVWLKYKKDFASFQNDEKFTYDTKNMPPM